MKYKYFLIFIFLINSTQALIAQELRIITKNPLPRKNQEIELEYFYSKSKIVNRFEAYIENGEENGFINGNIKFKDTLRNNSDINIGPINIRYNGVDYKSDSFKLKILDELPKTPDGIWINHINIDGSQFIIIEQRMIKSRIKKEFANFNLTAFYDQNVRPHEFYQETFFQNKIGETEYEERRTVLLIRNTENLKKNLVIDSTYFDDLPKNHEQIKLIIKR